jgi:hypothetical protein
LCAQLRRYGHISENAQGNVVAASMGRLDRPGREPMWPAATRRLCKRRLGGGRGCWHMLRSIKG